MDPLPSLIALTQALGAPDEDCVILAEGNTSARTGEETMLIKASGMQMAGADQGSFVEVHTQQVLRAIDGPQLDDEALRLLLAESRTQSTFPAPSTETFMHAFLLTLPDINFVGHTHPTPLLSLLCLPNCREIANRRLFPDEIVCCGPAACYVPYADPGIPLAKTVRDVVSAYVDKRGEAPRTIWLQNHGLVALGSTTQQVLAATVMQVKAARVWLGALSTGNELTTLTESQINRIHSRPDEHYRQRLLWTCTNN